MISVNAIERREIEVLQERIVLIGNSTRHRRRIRDGGGEAAARDGGVTERETERERRGPERARMGFTKMFRGKRERRVKWFI